MEIKKGQTLTVIYRNKLSSKLSPEGHSIRETVTEEVTVKRVARYKTGKVRVAVTNGMHGYTLVNPEFDDAGNVVINCK